MPTLRFADSTLLRQVRHTLERSTFFTNQNLLIVGVSGGPDSICLLYLLSRVAPAMGLQLHVAHLNHGLRGEDGEGDAACVQRHCESLGMLCTTAYVSALDYKAIHSQVTSLEEAAREVRYAYFSEIAHKLGAKAVAVGHTEDDQVETILLHLLRGSGITGLGGMSVESRWTDQASSRSIGILRPLMGVSRQATEEYCRRHRLETRLDSSNLSARFSRNRVRLELMPQLRSFNPSVHKALLRLAKQAQEEESYWQQEVRRVWPQVAQVGASEVALDTRQLWELPAPLITRLIRHAYGQLVADARGLESAHIDAIIRLLTAGSGKTLDLSNGVRMITQYARTILQRFASAETLVTPAPPAALNTYGDTYWNGWFAQAQLSPGAVWPALQSPWQTCLEIQSTSSVLRLRGRQPGDRFQPLGMTATKKLQDILVDAHVPRTLRDAVPLLEVAGDIAWVGGQRVGEQYKVTTNTRITLIVKLLPIADHTQRLLRSCDGDHYNT